MMRTVATRTVRIIGGKPGKHWYGNRFGQTRTVLPFENNRFWLDWTTKGTILKRHCRDLSKTPVKVGGTYLHYKGGYYTVLAQAVCSETLKDMVVYQNNETMVLFVRPLNSFTSSTRISGKIQKRFKLL